MMPQQLETSIREMCTDAMSQAVVALAEKYNFDVEEANRHLSLCNVKIAHKRGPSPKTVDEKPKVKGSPDKPKRGKTGYLLYADEVRDEVKAKLLSELDDGEKLKPQDIIKAIAARWKEESDETKESWKEKAKTPVTSEDEAPPEITTETPEEKPKPVAEKPKEKSKEKSKEKPKAKSKAKSKKDEDLESESDESD